MVLLQMWWQTGAIFNFYTCNLYRVAMRNGKGPAQQVPSSDLSVTHLKFIFSPILQVLMNQNGLFSDFEARF